MIASEISFFKETVICLISIKSSMHGTEDHRARDEINSTNWVLWEVHKLWGRGVFSKYDVRHISVCYLSCGSVLLFLFISLSLSLSLCRSKALWTSFWPPFQQSTCAQCHILGSFNKKTCLCAKLLRSCLTLCNPMDCSPPGFSVRGISQARILEWVATLSPRGSPLPRDQTHISYVSCIGSYLHH